MRVKIGLGVLAIVAVAIVGLFIWWKSLTYVDRATFAVNSSTITQISPVWVAHRVALARLRDPRSAIFGKSWKGSKGQICGLVNARTGLGGYSGDKVWLFDPSTHELLFQDQPIPMACDGNGPDAKCTMGVDAEVANQVIEEFCNLPSGSLSSDQAP